MQIDMNVGIILAAGVLVVPFEKVGIGVNTKKDLAESQKMYESVTLK